ncbi:RNA polymerase sigma factor [Reyranella sp.]|uniref:RNA polymerase sigma factor n=1 Tax=Reyranella sp. TaxID=1929291 RepID=UPI000BD6B8E2|nr:RNA polymerase sigma factor [Reyranella sp.]OYY34622.1 MAG: RNA polymerase subunit sigma-24 [Rhodospirillales bacterium 35-66-84]OYZ91051.1 MAG: RNA polymerase subunit sigma-24 [Rhodospirillales bacterium 24-66-33]OZB21543.1 MAG: RNA polymerase subunit sigma-24 [Rhodospirillales bacterium 39-66-50]HQS19133.1 RNA polymerase sigma factor [Reyranella sp.]HQT15303.1 RNA polymerase sigma factor [Reyranella sp.]
MSIDLQELSDSELVALSIAGRDRAFGEIVRRHRDVLYRIAFASLGDADDALDCVQDVFVSAHGALRRFDERRALRPWLVAIVLNRCRDLARRRRVRSFLGFALPLGATADTVAEDNPRQDDASVDRQELLRTVRAISQLPAALREPLVLHTMEGMSQAEAARTLGVSEKAIENRLRRARQQLRKQLDLQRR